MKPTSSPYLSSASVNVGVAKKMQMDQSSKPQNAETGLANSGGLTPKLASLERASEDQSKETLLQRLGLMLQSQELQLVFVVLIVSDFLAAFYVLYADARGWTNPFSQILEYLSGMALLAYVLELGLMLVAFKSEVFAHFGYALDIFLVSGMFYGVLITASWAASVRLLNVLRLWRVVRMVNAALYSSEQAHERTRAEVHALNEKIEALKLKAKRADLAQKREADKNKRLDQSFRAQRDELDTLREALQIAAQTMARVQGLEGIANIMGEQDQLELAKMAEEEDADEQESQSRRKARQFRSRGATALQRGKSVVNAAEDDDEGDEDDEDLDSAGFEETESGPETDDHESESSKQQDEDRASDFAKVSMVSGSMARGSKKMDSDNAERDIEERKEASRRKHMPRNGAQLQTQQQSTRPGRGSPFPVSVSSSD
mmetsp:Transcript_934/g.2187  ORF Transcript_934/g.2187 Transcript_934/m.2187 type:complete len:431 (+) Transcript_934:348-1640(+)|eukprot:CAMPEP_0171499738 /NCGR_PEP_ID=MMETSP0958-20121227/8596_1 /TAXON_ID=87120 /ORGANISM="Aurantiochytrium limacinum, Strain ATCCMYA-1381" /LENGTH=430 /DNA_ID=CAMNT_0012034329 /DNA_START=272 /DNA_END=1564 /DNA_ORIENTATION=-